MTKDKFIAYLAVQKSGLTNMFDVRNVCSLSGNKLTREDCIDIMKNYSKFETEFDIDIKSEII